MCMQLSGMVLKPTLGIRENCTIHHILDVISVVVIYAEVVVDTIDFSSCSGTFHRKNVSLQRVMSCTNYHNSKCILKTRTDSERKVAKLEKSCEY